MERLQQRWDDLAGPVVRVEQSVQAPPAEVCVAWLNPDRLAQWWWPQFPDTTYEVDAREGGGFRFRSEQAGLAVVLEHRLAKPGEDVDNPTQGWTDVMARLD